jgi:hypothetical protein
MIVVRAVEHSFNRLPAFLGGRIQRENIAILTRSTVNGRYHKDFAVANDVGEQAKAAPDSDAVGGPTFSARPRERRFTRERSAGPLKRRPSRSA